MGNWGNGIYDNDTSLDVKDDFELRYRDEHDVIKITKQLIKEYDIIVNDPCESEFFWLALADIQWNYGVLIDFVKDNAIDFLEKHRNKEYFSIEKDRKLVLDDLYRKLTSPMPKPKKIKKQKTYSCQWSIGDVYAYYLDSETARDSNLLGQYLLIQKVDETVWGDDHIVPIVYVKLTKDKAVPQSVEAYDQAEYIQMGFTRYENRFLPIDMNRPREDIAEKSEIQYNVDEYGLLPEFRLKLITTPKKPIPSKLIYVGNYENTALPTNEFIPHSKFNIKSSLWKKCGDAFELKVIECYNKHNLRKHRIYNFASPKIEETDKQY